MPLFLHLNVSLNDDAEKSLKIAISKRLLILETINKAQNVCDANVYIHFPLHALA